MPDAYDDYLRALDDEVARENDTRESKPTFFTALLDASERATARQIRGDLMAEQRLAQQSDGPEVSAARGSGDALEPPVLGTSGHGGSTTRAATCPCGEPSPKGSPPCTAERPCSYGLGMPRHRWGADASRESEASRG